MERVHLLRTFFHIAVSVAAIVTSVLYCYKFAIILFIYFCFSAPVFSDAVIYFFFLFFF